jgi:hypothetical protein
MHKFVANVFHRKLNAARPQVALPIEIALHVAVDRADKAVLANVKLAPVNQQRIVNVLLDYTGVALRYKLLD